MCIARFCTRSSSTHGARTPSACASIPSPTPPSAQKRVPPCRKPSSRTRSALSPRPRCRGSTEARGGYKHSVFSEGTDAEWRRINEQDAALFLLAGFTGLRLAELLALHLSDVDLERRILSVSRSMSAGEESSTRSRRSRSVPMTGQAASELVRLKRPGSFTG